jgi:Fe-S cluster assembly iron-binding protein IscA
MTETTIPVVTMTESAAKHIAEIIGEANPENKGLRIYITA